jgi:hypothetical protein
MAKELELEYRQFKLTSGEEIVCEVMEWNDEADVEILVRKAMRLTLMEMGDGTKFYSFRPWMVYQEHPEDILILNINTVVGIGFPPDSLLKQYHEAVNEMASMNETREQEFAESLKDSVDKIERYLTVMDSGSNVIDMFDPKKLH